MSAPSDLRKPIPSMAVVKKIPQVTDIGFWARRGRKHHLGAWSWERETNDSAHFYQFSIDDYALGINVLRYAMTHWG